MNIVISDPKTGKAYSKKTEEVVFLNRKLGEEVDLGAIGLNGFKARIKGGSDKQGFPMKPGLHGTTRRKALLKKGVGFRSKVKGKKKRKSVRGSTVSEVIAQLNLVVTQYGQKSLEEVLRTEMPESKKEKVEEKETSKERMIKASLEAAGKIDAEEAKKIKGKR